MDLMDMQKMEVLEDVLLIKQMKVFLYKFLQYLVYHMVIKEVKIFHQGDVHIYMEVEEELVDLVKMVIQLLHQVVVMVDQVLNG